jgi:RNA polymerase sigma-70 factor (ECF subfamily)
MGDGARDQFDEDLRLALDKLFRIAYRLTGNRVDAEELVQSTCLRACEERSAWGTLASPLSWLVRVQYHLFIDARRRSTNATMRSLADVNESEVADDRRETLEEHADRSQQLAKVEEAWERLAPDQKVLLALRLEGHSVSEIQEITGLGVNVLHVRLHRARQCLVQNLRGGNVAGAPRQRKEKQR